MSISGQDGLDGLLIAGQVGGKAAIHPVDVIMENGELKIVFEEKSRPGAKPFLNEEQIKEIWKLYENKQYTQQELASRYGVARTTITRIIKKKREDHA